MNSRVWSVVLLACGAIIALATVLPFALLRANRPQPAAIEFLSSTYEYGLYCPGDTVGGYKVTFNVNRAVDLYATTSHFKSEGGDTMQGNSWGNVWVTSYPEPRVVTEENASWTVPNFPPGEYERVLSVGTMGQDTDPMRISMSYGIRDDCTD